MKIEMRKEVESLLNLAGKNKTARKLAVKFQKTSTLSKRELKILRKLVASKYQVLAA